MKEVRVRVGRREGEKVSGVDERKRAASEKTCRERRSGRKSETKDETIAPSGVQEGQLEG